MGSSQRFLKILKPSLASPLTQAWLGALWIGTVGNWPLWQRMRQLPELSNAQGLGFTLVFMGIVTLLTAALLSLLAWPRVLKIALSISLLSAAGLAHFMGSYGIVVDPSMVVNVVQTNTSEAVDLLSLRLLASLLLLGVLPVWWLWRQPAAPALGWQRLAWNLLSFVAAIALMLALVMSSFADLASTMRNHKTLRYMINPLNAYFSIGVVLAQSQAKPDGPPEVVGADAHLLPLPAGHKPILLALVVGETARANNFSLNGYARPTNPMLAQREVLSFRAVSSCGTSTAASLPCMFSHLGREGYGRLDHSQENLLDLLQRAGLAVLWLDNQSGCKGVCERVPNSSTTTAAPGAPALPAGLCDGDECLDEALLQGLDQRLAALPAEKRARGVVLVMHQMGSHGPAYYKRSPLDAKPFQPECQSNALQQCPREQVLNAYDNSIAYTDRILAGAIDWLKAQTSHYEPALFYVSDHGESLGENNLYLHGLPYSVAPREQTHVPMVLWLPESSAQQIGVQRACLAQQLDAPLSHDNLFHTVLGLSRVRSQLYRADWDLMARCATP
jgi:lipid A ethanolaminephosphotransferase